MNFNQLTDVLSYNRIVLKNNYLSDSDKWFINIWRSCILSEDFKRQKVSTQLLKKIDYIHKEVTNNKWNKPKEYFDNE